MRARRPGRLARQLGIYAGLAPFLVIALFPVVWMVITAFKQEQDLYLMKFPLWFHLPPTLKHFDLLFTQTWFGAWVVNTIGRFALLLPSCRAAFAGNYRTVRPSQ